MDKQDLVIIGGGIMGLMTAYYASLTGKRVVILEKLTIGNKKASSFSFTRSIRNDYIDPFYARLAYEARNLWDELENLSPEKFIMNSGCLNIAKKSITPGLDKTYAAQSFETLRYLGYQSKKFGKTQLKKKFPQFNADLGCLDMKAGFLYLPVITNLLLNLLKQRDVKIVENVTVNKIIEKDNSVLIETTNKKYSSRSVVITAGISLNEVLFLVKDNRLVLPIIPDRPQQCKYFIPTDKAQFSPNKFPVFAYLDVGIYGHPFYEGKTKGVKIGFYNPPDFKKQKTGINSIEDFINVCMPSLKNAKSMEVKDADQCYYDLVKDDNFIIGKLPRYKNIFIGGGWRGTGYKFAPLIGKILSQISLQQGTIYDISRFSPERFVSK